MFQLAFSCFGSHFCVSACMFTFRLAFSRFGSHFQVLAPAEGLQSRAYSRGPTAEGHPLRASSSGPPDEGLQTRTSTFWSPTKGHQPRASICGPRAEGLELRASSHRPSALDISCLRPPALGLRLKAKDLRLGQREK